MTNLNHTAPLSIAVAMSGGVDSSVAAAMLRNAGHDVVGFTLKLWDAQDEEHARKVCCTTIMAHDAGQVCRQLGISHYTIDLRDQFRSEVIELFEREYMAGRTPNPCVHCNSRVKWGGMWDFTRSLGFQRIATGHYARLEPDGAQYIRLKRGLDTQKDQSYFLWEIPRPLLAKTLFPLGGLTKPEVRRLAREFNLPVAEKEESQEVCFIPGNDYRRWLEGRQPKLAQGEMTGEMVDGEGNVIARHAGYPYFTIGQRKGLGTGGGRKWFVTGIDAAQHRVFLGGEEELGRRSFAVDSMNVLTALPAESEIPCSVKVRYRDPGTPAFLILSEDGIGKVKLAEPVNAVTPGQSAVFYQGDVVIAGGIIRSTSK